MCEEPDCEKRAIKTHKFCGVHGWHGKNREKIASYQRKNREKYRWGLPVGTCETVLQYQDGCCALCGIEAGEQAFDVDHDHETLLFRGLLCRHCNRTIIGLIEQNPDLIKRAILYLENPPAQQINPGIKVKGNRK